MIVDTSALIAILKQEPEAALFSRRLEEAGGISMSAATVLEASMVAGLGRQLDLFDIIACAGIDVVPFDEQQAMIASNAHFRFGKKSGSPAQLNFGDCMTYALAKAREEPLLFKGDDFTHTDITPAL